MTSAGRKGRYTRRHHYTPVQRTAGPNRNLNRLKANLNTQHHSRPHQNKRRHLTKNTLTTTPQQKQTQQRHLTPQIPSTPSQNTTRQQITQQSVKYNSTNQVRSRPKQLSNTNISPTHQHPYTPRPTRLHRSQNPHHTRPSQPQPPTLHTTYQRRTTKTTILSLRHKQITLTRKNNQRRILQNLKTIPALNSQPYSYNDRQLQRNQNRRSSEGTKSINTYHRLPLTLRESTQHNECHRER